MSEPYYYGLSFQTWLLLGIITYVLVVLFLIYVKYCVSRQVFCPSSNCYLHCTHFGLSCRDAAATCSRCGGGGPFCCSSGTHSATGVQGPEVKCRCFAPSCTYLYCFCCEASLENKREQV